MSNWSWWDRKAPQSGVIRLRAPRQTTFDLRPEFGDPEGLPVADPRPSDAGFVSYRLSYAVSHSPTPKPGMIVENVPLENPHRYPRSKK